MKGQNIRYYLVNTTHPEYAKWLDQMRAQFAVTWPENVLGINSKKGALQAIVQQDWGAFPEWTGVTNTVGIVLQTWSGHGNAAVVTKVNEVDWKPDEIQVEK